jgi:PadR family transcriptional regulator, regulatory protein PadR
MTHPIKLSLTSALILRTIGSGYRYGFDVMAVTGLPSGTVYPALHRLERDGLIKSTWEQAKDARAAQRPPRKNYSLSKSGAQAVDDAIGRYPLLDQLTPATKD